MDLISALLNTGFTLRASQIEVLHLSVMDGFGVEMRFSRASREPENFFVV
jgi:hypothetical protein